MQRVPFLGGKVLKGFPRTIISSIVAAFSAIILICTHSFALGTEIIVKFGDAAR